jgi:hypothetical protein
MRRPPRFNNSSPNLAYSVPVNTRAIPANAAHLTRRTFCAKAAAAATSILLPLTRLIAQSSGNAIRPDVAAIDHDRILHDAEQALTEAPVPITRTPAPHSPAAPQDYFSEATDSASATSNTAPFTAHRDAVFSLGQRVSSLAAAQWITGEKRYGDFAALHLRSWFADPATRLTPSFDFAQVPTPASPSGNAPPPSRPALFGTYAGVIESLPLVEVVQSIPFLAGGGSLTSADLTALRTWFSDYLHWLTAEQDSGPRIAALARDHKDHHATSWMLQVAAYTLFTAPETGAPKNEDRAMTELRHRFRSVTLRTQLSADGMFRNELSTPNPYRNSLFNLDMLACLSQLLSTRFESAWEYELEDGPSMHTALAWHAPFIQDRVKWPYRADDRFFNDLPSRRTALLLGARAFQRPEYASLWKTLRPDPVPPEIARTIPARQPLLWTVQPHRPAVER